MTAVKVALCVTSADIHILHGAWLAHRSRHFQSNMHQPREQSTLFRECTGAWGPRFNISYPMLRQLLHSPCLKTNSKLRNWLQRMLCVCHVLLYTCVQQRGILIFDLMQHMHMCDGPFPSGLIPHILDLELSRYGSLTITVLLRIREGSKERGKE
jgi:hypothetical protein